LVVPVHLNNIEKVPLFVEIGQRCFWIIVTLGKFAKSPARYPSPRTPLARRCSMQTAMRPVLGCSGFGRDRRSGNERLPKDAILSHNSGASLVGPWRVSSVFGRLLV
jgi:hypothetical protein